ncbi:arsenite efflux membrane protein ArsB [Kribbella amoyensis]|uniref:Arsenite efflux membrane protein ArsB n=1 Tax=Kribbella amoyensis TaxID=996641 RepID=A0A561BZ18_9ACTN|nr:SLC13 family permease [Kribbella amoyensis]TWD84123.1 arsenite efflux membrane protein ArsB [Kribbella amoyensis]
MWWVSALGALGVLGTGLLGAGDALAVIERIGPVLIFLVAVTVIAGLADTAKVFDVAAREAAHLGKGRTWRLWLLVVALATASTVVLSLDTAAVLLTPVVLAMARQLQLPPKLFAFTTVWLAGTASLLLPVSNLTNLLALHQFHQLDLGLRDYLGLSWRPALAAILITVAVLAALFHRDLGRPYAVPPTPVVDDKVLFWGAAGVCLALGPAFVSGVEVAWPAGVGALILIGLFAVRRRDELTWSLIPWRLVVTVVGLFLLVAALTEHGLERVLGEIAGTSSDGLLADLRLTTTAAAGANAVDNLPAYLAMEPVAATEGRRLTLLLIGVNFGCLLTLWGSLATLLWRDRCRTAGVHISWWSFLWRGLILTPLVLAGAVLALNLS